MVELDIKSFIKRHDALYYWILCFFEGRKPEYRAYCLDYKKNPRLLHFLKCGEQNPEKNIYHIYVGDNAVGMFSLCTWTLRYLEFADRFFLTPVVSWDKTVSYFRKGGVNGISNPFEYYFQQPAGISVEEVKDSYSVAISRHQDRAYGNVADSYDFSEDEISRLSRIWHKYVRLQPWLEKEIKAKVVKLLQDEKVLGIHVRGADWRNMNISGHPVTASEEEYIQEVRSVMEQYHYGKVFLATDSEGTLEKFQKAFGEKLLYFPEIKRTPKDSSSLVIFDEANDPYRLGVEILLDAYMLAACDGLIAGVSYVSYGVQIIKKSRGEEFGYLKIINKGLQKKSSQDFKKAAQRQRKEIKKRQI